MTGLIISTVVGLLKKFFEESLLLVLVLIAYKSVDSKPKDDDIPSHVRSTEHSDKE
jgi:hypothetical protein